LQHRLNRRPLEKLDLPANRLSNLIALRDALATDAPVTWNDVEVKRHNTLQIVRSSRFIYGPTADFSDVVATMDANPSVGEVESSLSVGPIGPRSRMPPGHWLVLFGKHDSYMVPVADMVDGWPLEATVTDDEALTMALDDGPFSELQYFVDHQQRLGMRDVSAERSSADRRRVIIRHCNEGLNKLMSALQGRCSPLR
jgi:hypothetical protein